MMKTHLKNLRDLIFKGLFVYALAGGIYLLIESFFRGYTFLEMYYLAGFLGVLCLLLNEYAFTYNTDFILQVLINTVLGTLAEGTCGYFFNYDFHIWDYRGLPGTFFNQQCNVIFVLAWLLIYTFVIPLLDYIDWKVFHYMEDTPPYYMIFGRKVFQFKG